jgi:hemerythrin-like domain-containing protein
MDSQSPITHYMLQDHQELEALLFKLTEGFGVDKKEFPKLFANFKDKLEHHMQTEEQAIFSFSELGDMSTMNVVRELLVQHSALRSHLEDMALKVHKREALENFQEFSELLDQHQSIEGNVLYPKLDRELGDREKAYIVKKINSIR